MKRLIDSAMETMHVLGCNVSEIKDAVTTLMKIVEMPVITALPEEPYPIRAFPDHFYVKPVVAEEPRPKPTYTVTNLTYFPHKPRPVVEYPGQWCHCGHKWEEHMPACVYLIQGCGCEEFMPVPKGVMEGA